MFAGAFLGDVRAEGVSWPAMCFIPAASLSLLFNIFTNRIIVRDQFHVYLNRFEVHFL